MKLMMTVSLLIATSFVSIARADKEVNNGAGLSEQNVVHAHANARLLLEPCLQTPACDFDENESRSVLSLTKVIQSSRLLFLTTNELGSQLTVRNGSEWQINGELLWKDSDRTLSYTLADAMDLLLSIADSEGTLTNVTREKIRHHLESNSRELRIDVGSGLHVDFLHWQDRQRLGARDAFTAVDVTQEISRKLGRDLVRFLDPVLQGAELAGQDRARVHFTVKVRADGPWTLMAFTLEVPLREGAPKLSLVSVSLLEARVKHAP